MKVFRENSARIRRNAEFILRDLGGCRPGEHLLLIADDASRENALALADVARELGLHPLVADIDSYGRGQRYLAMPSLRPLRAAILASDAAFMLTDQMLTDFGLFLGDGDAMDASLTGAGRRYTLEARGLPEWDLRPEEIIHFRERTSRLHDLLQRGGLLRVRTARGTDFSCDMASGTDGMYPVLGILPFYAEVAVIPKLGCFNGVLMVDGASQCAWAQRGFPIRPAVPGHQELYLEPLRIDIRDGRVTGCSGPAAQVERLEKWMYESSPHADLADEIGLVTTTARENDQYGWLIDGTHQTHCVHVALGNNTRRGELIHAPEHCDFDMHDPEITLDGRLLYAEGEFHDEVIFARTRGR
ncbi:MAG: hypothetical protein PHC30_09905 [Lentisphaeria bacterium]|nr:hypothetical protein [Lentisphaeria bacterium]